MAGTYNDREWIKTKGLKGLAQNAHIKDRQGPSRFGRCFGQDLMRGEHRVGERKNKLSAAETTERLTWVAGDRDEADLDEVSRKILAAQPESGTSIFDPVLCELAYRWFCPDGGSILDPFAGGSVRGIIAAVLGRQYTGIDLRPEQIAANVEQAVRIVPDKPPRWIVGDSRDVRKLARGKYDLIFSCPPYGDLERYSDDPRDLSTMDHPAFLDAYRAIITACVGMLKPNRFAVFVVGDIRDERGFYRNLPASTTAAFHDAGATLYNEAVLITAVGSLPIRISRQFAGYRKLGKTHQNVLVFFKGDPKTIMEEFGEIAPYEPGEEFGEVDESYREGF
jgi:DNA modification methylase